MRHSSLQSNIHLGHVRRNVPDFFLLARNNHELRADSAAAVPLCIFSTKWSGKREDHDV